MAGAQKVYPRGMSADLDFPAALLKFDPNSYKADTNADLVVTYDADAARSNVVRQIFLSFSAAPAAGTYIQIEDGSGTVALKLFLGAAAIDYTSPLTFDPPLSGTKNTSLIVTLKAGGSGIGSTLYVSGYKEE